MILKMRWKAINEGLEVRLCEGRLEFCSREGLSLRQVVEIVSVWARLNEDQEVESWLEVAEDEADLAERTERALELARFLRDIFPDWGTTPEKAREQAIREREFERGKKAFADGCYEKAVQHLKPLAESGWTHAQFLLGVMSAKGAGVPRDNISAYVWLDLAARANFRNAAEARNRVAERLSAPELAEAQQRAKLRQG